MERNDQRSHVYVGLLPSADKYISSFVYMVDCSWALLFSLGEGLRRLRVNDIDMVHGKGCVRLTWKTFSTLPAPGRFDLLISHGRLWLARHDRDLWQPQSASRLAPLCLAGFNFLQLTLQLPSQWNFIQLQKDALCRWMDRARRHNNDGVIQP